MHDRELVREDELTAPSDLQALLRQAGDEIAAATVRTPGRKILWPPAEADDAALAIVLEPPLGIPGSAMDALPFMEVPHEDESALAMRCWRQKVELRGLPSGIPDPGPAGADS